MLSNGRGLETEENTGLFLPSRVVLYQDGDSMKDVAIEPRTMSQITSNGGLAEVAQEARPGLMLARSSL